MCCRPNAAQGMLALQLSRWADAGKHGRRHVAQQQDDVFLLSCQKQKISGPCLFTPHQRIHSRPPGQLPHLEKLQPHTRITHRHTMSHSLPLLDAVGHCFSFSIHQTTSILNENHKNYIPKYLIAVFLYFLSKISSSSFAQYIIDSFFFILSSVCGLSIPL